MNRIYLIIAVVGLFIGAYFYGVNITLAKCKIQTMAENTKNTEQLIQNQRIIHDTVYKTGVDDIRRILHDKYTIAK